MNNYLEILLKKINMPIELYDNFKGKLNKIVVENKTKYVLELELIDSLPINTYLKFLELTLKKFEEVEIIINLENKTNIEEYFLYFLNSLEEKSYFLDSLKEANLSIDNNLLIINVDSILLENKVKEIEKTLITFLNKAGFNIINIETKIEKKENNEVGEMIEKELDVSSLNLKDNTQEVTLKPQTKYERKPRIMEDKPNVLYGREIEEDVSLIKNVLSEVNNVTLEAYMFGNIDIRTTKTDLKIVTLKITDETDSIYAKMFINNDDELERINNLKTKIWYKFRGSIKDDAYSKELTFMIRDINTSDRTFEKRIDEAPQKRVELHAHTMMSQMDGVVTAEDLINQALKWGHRGIAITDHNGCQSFPTVYKTVKKINSKKNEGEEPFKALYGTELLLIDDTMKLVVRDNNTGIFENTYVVFDFETTGFNAGGGDTIIEVGAVKLLNGEIIDTFSELVNPGRDLPKKIIEVTGITDEMLKGKDNEEVVIKRFIEWFKDYPMVAHNAKFDVSFLEMAYKKYSLGEFTNTVLDTLELSRTLDSEYSRHSLSALVKRYDIPFDEDSHHRADYDAKGTALVFHKMLKKLYDRNLRTLDKISELVSKDEIHKFGRSYHVNLIALNKIGLKNLFKLISYANTKYLYKTPRILRSEIEAHREGILIGSGCYESEVFIEARSKSEEELSDVIKFYDYVEIQPLDVYSHLVDSGDFGNQAELIDSIKKIIRVSKEAEVMVVATGDVHHMNKEDKIYREIIVNQKVPGGGRHPLSKYLKNGIPSQHFRTTTEMLEDFSFIDEETRREIVITNPNKILDMSEVIEVIVETGGVPFSPKIENSVDTVKELVYGKAKELYGDPIPELINIRIEQELNGIIKGGYDVIYLIAQKLVKKSNDDGYLVGSRGSVGSSFVAYLMGISEVNPLQAHYVCSKCKHSIFEIDNQELAKNYSSGVDLPDLSCPKCGTDMLKDGQDMPFATFLGFDADKVPDIDLNFSGEYQWKAHEYTKELFGVDNVYRAGTIGTVAEKTAFGFVKGYYEDMGVNKKNSEIERLAVGCTGVKRTTGQHPGGIVVIPGYMDVFDFTPFQYPADDPTSLWRTTHFEYHAIEEDVLKLDILGHDDPTVLRMLQDFSGIDVNKIPLSDKKTMSIFSSPEVLGVTKEQIMCETGTLGIPEFGTKFVIGMLVDTRPQTFSELIKISGLSHGTDVWLNNAQDLIRNKIISFKDVIGCRDDIMIYLSQNGVESKKAFKIMEFVRKGLKHKGVPPEIWQEHEKAMRDANIPEWYIDSCSKIKYMFPKAHASAYVTSAFRIAYFKVHHPLWYYAAYFSIRCVDFDIEAMIEGYDAIKRRIEEIINKGYEASNKEVSIQEVLEVALEASARGIKFANLDIYKSDAVNFIIKDENTLIPPFRSIEGLGDTVAKNIVLEREKREFMSIEDLSKRAKVSSTLIDKFRVMGLLEGMDESNQLSLF